MIVVMAGRYDRFALPFKFRKNLSIKFAPEWRILFSGPFIQEKDWVVFKERQHQSKPFPLAARQIDIGDSVVLNRGLAR
jgi:hypothetical protein